MVIQTFLSKERSEETQVKGRTARQGQKGQYRLALRSSQLETVGVKMDDVAKMEASGVSYRLLNDRRNDFFRLEYESNRDHVLFSKLEHDAAMIFLRNLAASNFKEVMTYLLGQNKAPKPPPQLQRTMILMDATGSMSGLIVKSKAVIGQTFWRLTEILKENGYPENCFQLQLVAYRNYSVPTPDHLIQDSGWQSQPGDLKKWLTTVTATGGICEEAVEVGLQHAVAVAKEPQGLSQVLLIADAPPNPPAKILGYRAQYRGEAVWSTIPRVAVATDYETELAKLISLKVPVHTFPVGNQAWVEPSFKSIATRSGGESYFLDVNSSNGAELLTNTIAQRVLQTAASSPEDAAALLRAYKERDWKAHRAPSN